MEESVYPYEPDQWGLANDSACEGNNQPTRCYTNGEPSDEVKNAPNFTFPRGDWLRATDIKTHMMNKKPPVVIGVPFYYQSWNHGASKLGVSKDKSRNGFITYPTDADKADSEARPSGHSVLVVGWDDEQGMPILDGEGNQERLDDGSLVTEKGCYIFKNSWGTGVGSTGHWGPGYGCISYRYVHEYASADVAGLPEAGQLKEVCDDRIDNNNNGSIDCADAACSEAIECGWGQDILREYIDTPEVDIPDDDPAGIGSTISILETGEILNFLVEVDIVHTYRGDLEVTLYRGEQAIVVHEADAESVENLKLAVEISDFVGTELAGDYRLVVSDLAENDTGTLVHWGIKALVSAQ